MLAPLTLAFQGDEAMQHHKKGRPQLLRARGIPLHRAKVNDQLLGAKLHAPYCVIQIAHDTHQLSVPVGVTEILLRWFRMGGFGGRTPQPVFVRIRFVFVRIRSFVSAWIELRNSDQKKQWRDRRRSKSYSIELAVPRHARPRQQTPHRWRLVCTHKGGYQARIDDRSSARSRHCVGLSLLGQHSKYSVQSPRC